MNALRLKNINLHSPYRVWQTQEDSHYYFQTDLGIQYDIITVGLMLYACQDTSFQTPCVVRARRVPTGICTLQFSRVYPLSIITVGVS